MLEAYIIAFLVVVVTYLGTTLRERNARIAAMEISLANAKTLAKAYLNRLIEKQGTPMIYDETGAVVLNPPVDDSPFAELVPPFAQAERRWEEEEAEEKAKTPNLSSLVPDLDEVERERLRSTYKPEPA